MKTLGWRFCVWNRGMILKKGDVDNKIMHFLLFSWLHSEIMIWVTKTKFYVYCHGSSLSLGWKFKQVQSNEFSSIPPESTRKGQFFKKYRK